MAKGDPYCFKCGLSWSNCECDITEKDPLAPVPTLTNAPDPVIRFGQYAGKRASTITDVRYLDWMLGVTAYEPFKAELLAHLKGRKDWQDLENE